MYPCWLCTPDPLKENRTLATTCPTTSACQVKIQGEIEKFKSTFDRDCSRYHNLLTKRIPEHLPAMIKLIWLF
jgi:hypothetical protein